MVDTAFVTTPAGPIANRALPAGSDALPGGARGHWQTSEVGCLECCIATILGCEFEEVPGQLPAEHSKVQELDATEALHAWVRDRGCRTHYREITPEIFDRYWIGVSVDPRPGWDHTVICLGRAVVFDPALAVPVPAGCMVEPVRELHYAITFDRLESA